MGWGYGFTDIFSPQILILLNKLGVYQCNQAFILPAESSLAHQPKLLKVWQKDLASEKFVLNICKKFFGS